MLIGSVVLGLIFSLVIYLGWREERRARRILTDRQRYCSLPKNDAVIMLAQHKDILTNEGYARVQEWRKSNDERLNSLEPDERAMILRAQKAP